MRIHKHFLILVLALSLSSFNDNIQKDLTKNHSNDLELDHFNIWVKNPRIAKEQLTNIGFTSIPDSLSQVHMGQGTAGKYFYFLNCYLELIFVYDQIEMEENNRKNKDLDFTVRASFEKNGASPFSVALKLEDFDARKIPFEKINYHQEWMEDNVNIYSAKNSKLFPKEPSIFIVYPEIEYKVFESLSDLQNIPNEYAFSRAFYKHPNGAQKITSITISSHELDMKTETIKALNGIEILKINNSKEHLMELHFDNDIQGKSYDLRPELPLIVYL